MKRAFDLSKSKFMTGDHCLTHLWLDTHARNKAAPMGSYLRYIVQEGTRFGEWARTQFPQGKLIQADHRHIDQALHETQRFLSQGETCLFEPAYIFQRTLIRADVLRLEKDNWVLTEVKAAKPNLFHYLDLAVQTFVLEGNGLPIGRVEVLSPDFQSSTGESLRPHITDVTQKVRSLIPEIEPKVHHFIDILSHDTPPEAPLGSQCFRAYPCPFLHTCWPDHHGPSIFAIPRLNASRANQMLALGIRSMKDIPLDYPLSPPQRELADLYARPGLTVFPPALKDFLKSLTTHTLIFVPQLVFQILPMQPSDRSLMTIPYAFSWGHLTPGHEFTAILPPGSRDFHRLSNQTEAAITGIDTLVVWQEKDALAWFRSLRLSEIPSRLKILPLKPLFDNRFLFDPRWKEITLDEITRTLCPASMQTSQNQEDDGGSWLLGESAVGLEESLITRVHQIQEIIHSIIEVTGATPLWNVPRE